jgi:hypothetical protein
MPPGPKVMNKKTDGGLGQSTKELCLARAASSSGFGFSGFDLAYM